MEKISSPQVGCLFPPLEQTASVDKTCDQAVPTSLVAADYVTFPSLPLNVAVTDHFTLVAVYANTTITVRITLKHFN